MNARLTCLALALLGASLAAQENPGFRVATTATVEPEFGTRLSTTVQLPAVKFDFEPPPGWGAQVDSAALKIIYRAPDDSAAITLAFKLPPPALPGATNPPNPTLSLPAPVKLADRVVRQFHHAEVIEEYDCFSRGTPQRAAFFGFSNQPGTHAFGRFVLVPFADGELEVMLIALTAEAGRGNFNTLVNSLGSKPLP